jgi:hypothetical protein
MTDVRRTGPPRRLENRTRLGIPIEGEVDGIWQRAFHAELVAEVQRHPDLPGADFFGRSLTINPELITFYFTGEASSLSTYLDMLEAAIAPSNRAARTERDRLAAAATDAEHRVHDRDDDIERELRAWVEKQPVAV